MRKHTVITITRVVFLTVTQLLWSSHTFAASDSAPPGIVIWPIDDSTVSGNVQINATAWDNASVTKVEFAVNGVSVGEDTAAPYTYVHTTSWDSTTHANGITEIQATAFDAAGNTSEQTLYVTVNNQESDTRAPGVVMIGPSDGASVSGDVRLNATAWDNVGVTKVEFAVDGVWVGEDTAAPHNYQHATTWDSTTHAGGIAEIQATAFDAAGNTSEQTLYVTVDNYGGTETGFQCHGCDDTNIKELDTIDSYDNAKGLNKALSLWRIPWLEYDYIPQGVHVTEDDLVYMSMYHKDADGISSKSSIIIKYSTATNTVIDVYHLKNSNGSNYMGHVGGLVVKGDYFIVPYGSKLNFFKQSNATPVSGIESEIKSEFTTGVEFGESEYNTKMSFLSISKDHQNQDVLWTGQFNKNNNVGSHILGYKIDSDGTVDPAPIYKFYVPETVNKLQGVTVLNASHDAYTLLLSRSYGNSSSYIYKVEYDRQESLLYKYDYRSKIKVFIGPAGLEDLHVTADGIWSVSESGANYYQNRTTLKPWDQLFPFLIKLRISDM